ncbi:MAG: teichuronic acid biosynthesis glycosyltransferase tuaH, partial [Chloroflexi bacterium]|nr:teichuronic acid biosynthesis glycosyltransferase tuaH [Chloroflexota bacterium]
LAQGLPVVSTPIPGALDFGEVLHIGSNALEFKEAIRLAMAEDNDEKRQHRLALAQANSWDARFQELHKILGDLGIL